MKKKWYSFIAVLLIVAVMIFIGEQVYSDEGNSLFPDSSENQILKWSEYGNLSTFLKNATVGSGIFFDKNGKRLTSVEDERKLISTDQYGKVTVLDDVFDYGNKNIPIELWINPKGGIYFIHTSLESRNNSDNKRKYVYYLSPDRKSLIRVADDLSNPESLIGSPNGIILYIVDSDDSSMYFFDINADGQLTNKRLYDPIIGDGSGDN